MISWTSVLTEFLTVILTFNRWTSARITSPKTFQVCSWETKPQIIPGRRCKYLTNAEVDWFSWTVHVAFHSGRLGTFLVKALIVRQLCQEPLWNNLWGHGSCNSMQHGWDHPTWD
jgi:hypothetical protein